MFSNISKRDPLNFEEKDFALNVNELIERLSYDQLCILMALNKHDHLSEFKKKSSSERVEFLRLNEAKINETAVNLENQALRVSTRMSNLETSRSIIQKHEESVIDESGMEDDQQSNLLRHDQSLVQTPRHTNEKALKLKIKTSSHSSDIETSSDESRD